MSTVVTGPHQQTRARQQRAPHPHETRAHASAHKDPILQRYMPAARLLIPVLLGALLSRADACSSNSDCSENTFCSVNSEGCMKCFWDWSDAEIKGDYAKNVPVDELRRTHRRGLG